MLNEHSLKEMVHATHCTIHIAGRRYIHIVDADHGSKAAPPKPTPSYTQPRHRCRLLTAQTSLNRHAVKTKRQQKPTDCDRFVYIDRNFNLDSSSELREFACLFPFTPAHPRTLLKLTSSNRHAVTSKQQP